MFLENFISAKPASSVLLLVILMGCDTCEPPHDLSGVYFPDLKTRNILEELGYLESPNIEIQGNFTVIMHQMPAVWRHWQEAPPLSYETVAGHLMNVSEIGNGQVAIDVETINGKSDPFVFAGAKSCLENRKPEIRIPYKGWDQGGPYLIFTQQKPET